ncbi:MAG: DNA topoisomerase (ATP-hydrolyzing) subunit B [Ardenticatenales bacterium]|nr:DNA topoisomerase (ATP-hydrolyzing) subunit B [Ardenticatenales bacterium]
MATKTTTYDASTIQVMEGLEAVRKRPGMYIGNTDIMGLHHCVFEVVDNSVDEALQGHGSRIDVIIHPDQTMTVRDYARGIPVDIHQPTGLPALEVIMTKLHAGGKFGGAGYKVSGGLHGIGVKAVNAVSEWMEVTVRRDGKIYRQRYERGNPVTEVKVVGKTKKDDTGTETRWKYDPEIFKAEGLEYNFKTLAHRFRDMCFLTPGLQISLVDEREPGLEATYYFQGGIAAFVQFLNRTRERLHPVMYIMREVDEVLVEVAMQYTDGYQESIHTFANNINQPEGGTHLTGFRSALTRTINDYARRSNQLKEKDTNFSGDDVREGLTAIVSVKVKDPQFEAQTKIKLNNTEVKGAVESTLNDALSTWLEENPRSGKAIVGKVLTASRARAAMKKARDMVIRKSALESLTLPGKLADCSERDPEKTELFIVEGDSAGGCFSGDTEVALADGRNVSFEQLVAEQAQGKRHFCYTIRKDGTVGLAQAIHARVTKRDVAVIRLTLDNGGQIVCTPDHRFMLRDGSYKAARNLSEDDSLMPLYRKLSNTDEGGITIDGYEMTWNPPTDGWLFTHVLADWYNRSKGVYRLEDGDHCHHIDFNKLNNDPTNIRRMPADEHRALHRRHVKKTLHRPDVVAKWRAVRESDEQTIAALRGVSREQGVVDVEGYRAYRINTGDKSLLRFDSFCDRHFDGDGRRASEAVANYNHRVVSIERVAETMDVYDIEVPHTHNFALASGVFVHNSAKGARDRRFQAILPLRGKIINVEKARINRILDNREVQALISALGCGIGDSFDLANLRYSRVVVMTDADVDGAHIRTLLLTFFFRYMQPLIEHGHLFIAQPPLYQIKAGKSEQYVYTEAEKEATLKQMGDRKVGLQRYKGLGEMNPEQLWETTLNPENRTMLQVTIEDAVQADKTFDMLMGSAVPPRKRFIQTHAREVRNLDI